jgi:hypothetical protein
MLTAFCFCLVTVPGTSHVENAAPLSGDFTSSLHFRNGAVTVPGTGRVGRSHGQS